MSQSCAIRFSPTLAELATMRSRLVAAGIKLGASEKQQNAIVLVADELANNAIEHGASYRQTPGELFVEIERNRAGMRFVFVDPDMPDEEVAELADHFHAATNDLPALESERGRGLFLITVYLDGLNVGRANGGGLFVSGVFSGDGGS